MNTLQKCLSLTACLTALAFPMLAMAQSNTSFQVENFEPLPSQGINTLNIGKADVLGHLKPSVGLFFNYMKEPLVVVPTGGDLDDAGSGRLIDNQLKAELLADVGLFDLLSFGVAVPFVLYQNGDPLTRLGSNESVESLVLADIRLIPKILLINPRSDWSRGFGAALMLPVYIPTGDDKFQGDGNVRVEPRLALSWMHDSGLSLSGNLGVQLLRNSSQALNVEPGNTLRYGVGLEVPSGWDRMKFIASYYGNYGFNDASGVGASSNVDSDSPMEIDGGVQFLLPANLVAQLGAGTGLNASVGSPVLRGFASINYTPMGEPEPVSPDIDGDGILNEQDQCPSESEDFDQFEDVDGCPDKDNDADGILDAEDKCPLKPEDIDKFKDGDGCPEPDNDNDGILDADDRCPLEPEDKDGFEDKDGCPDPDNDLDGVPDTNDLCPQQSEDQDGFDDTDGCPDPDNDGDGVLDVDDKCPLKPGVVSEGGCPVQDRDKDGIADNKDKCPDKAETFNGIKDNDGCPDGKAAAKIEDGRIVILKKVYFATSKDVILKKSYPVLRAVAGILRANPQVTQLRIEGHTDDVGKDESNMDLSKRRAASVRTFMLEKEQIAPRRLMDAGYGETVPLCQDLPELSKTKRAKRKNRRKIKKCRADNRRVEFVVTGVNGKPVSRKNVIKATPK